MGLFDTDFDLFTPKRRTAPAVRAMIAPGDYGGAAYAPPVQPSTTPYATATPSPSIAVGKSFTPDYASLIKSDPGYVSAMSGSTLDVSQAAASRREALRRLA